MRTLQARMEQMDRVPTRSFFHSYAGEFDMLQGEDRRALRRENEFETSTKIENSYRNRYVNILSNEPTRVKLQDIAPGENDYINANLVSGHDAHPGYIATQAPLPETMPHFWQMVYESVTPVIVMLTREQEDHCTMTKSDRYWPAVGEDVLFDNYLVHGLEENATRTPGIIERRFQVARVVDSRKKHAKDLVDADSLIPHSTEGTVWQTPARGRSQSHCDDDSDACEDNEELMRHLEAIGTVLEVVQLQYIDWPDQEVPEDPHSLLDLVSRVDALSSNHFHRNGVKSPPVVHCSAGVGRTGTFIAIDKMLRRLWDAFSYPAGAACLPVCVEEIRELVREMKNERSRMVQTPEQYKFIYEAVLSALKGWEAGHLTFVDWVRGPQGTDGMNGGLESHAQDGARQEGIRSQAQSHHWSVGGSRGFPSPMNGHASR